MNTALLSMASELIRRERTFVVATVVRRESPSSARLGDTAIVTHHGTVHGFIGGSCTRATVVDQALMVLARGEPRLISFRDDDQERADDIVSVPMTCHSGGSVEIYIDPVLPVPRLLVLGSSPVTEAIARLGKAMGYTVHVGGAEDRGDLSEQADEIVDSLEGLEGRYASRATGVKLFVLVATMGESDETMLASAIGARPDYLGVVASRRRMEEIRETLTRRGVSAEAIATIRGPAGLDLGASRPEEIAISILAEIVSSGRQDTALSRDNSDSETCCLDPAAAPADSGGEA